MSKYTITMTLTEPILGTAPLNKELYAEYIASRVNDTDVLDEIDSVPDAIEKGTTGFHRDEDGAPILYDYVIKGFFKDAAGMLRRVPDTKSSKLTSYKKVIDGLVFVRPRTIPIQNGGEIGILERPLRAQTAQGERVALSRSEMIPAGAKITFTLDLLDGKLEPAVREWLDYGAMRGLGQWRNGGYGTFTYEMTPA
jgi:hypothetical protein